MHHVPDDRKFGGSELSKMNNKQEKGIRVREW
jgi:hypothetical protein